MKVEPRRLYGATQRQAEHAMLLRLASDPDARECLVPFYKDNAQLDTFIRCYEQRKAAKEGRS